MKWSENHLNVYWSEVQFREGRKNETLLEKFIWSIKWWEVKGWGEKAWVQYVWEKYCKLYTVISYRGVVYRLYMLCFKMSCVYCC